METIAIALGIAATKLIARIWTHDTVLEGPDHQIIDFLGRRIHSDIDKRGVSRQLGQLADDIAERIAPFLSVEVQGIEEGELKAAAIAADESLKRAHGTDPATLFAVDLSAAELVRVIRSADPNAASRAGLNEQGVAVYDTLLSECASFILTISHKLPGFELEQTRELLTRSSRLAEVANGILDGLPTSAVPTEWGRGSEDQRFENKYRRAVTEYSDQLQLFGVTSVAAKSRYPLSVAYISMAVDDLSKPALVEDHDSLTARSRHAGAEKNDDNSILRIEALLDDTSYLLLTGGAGSGKTTLIQWIALSSVADSGNLQIAESWQKRFPFVIPLRRFVGKEFPSPEQFVALIAPNLSGVMPPGWTHRILSSGQGTLLVDGLDEVPIDERETAREWIAQLIRDFPDSKVLVTSRTTAITKGWEDQDKFRRAELLPMEPSDIRAFVSHWHSAARAIGEFDRQAEIATAETGMLSIVRDRPAVRSLCTSPLLCALMCALHLENGSTLPNNRMDVYKTALEMLVLRRDTERKIQIFNEVELGYTEREIILRKFAMWMHDNGASDAVRDDYESSVARTLRGLYRVASSSNDVASYLLERSGVLREPIPGRSTSSIEPSWSI